MQSHPRKEPLILLFNKYPELRISHPHIHKDLEERQRMYMDIIHSLNHKNRTQQHQLETQHQRLVICESQLKMFKENRRIITLSPNNNNMNPNPIFRPNMTNNIRPSSPVMRPTSPPQAIKNISLSDRNVNEFNNKNRVSNDQQNKNQLNMQADQQNSKNIITKNQQIQPTNKQDQLISNPYLRNDIKQVNCQHVAVTVKDLNEKRQDTHEENTKSSEISTNMHHQNQPKNFKFETYLTQNPKQIAVKKLKLDYRRYLNEFEEIKHNEDNPKIYNHEYLHFQRQSRDLAPKQAVSAHTVDIEKLREENKKILKRIEMMGL